MELEEQLQDSKYVLRSKEPVAKLAWVCLISHVDYGAKGQERSTLLPLMRKYIPEASQGDY